MGLTKLDKNIIIEHLLITKWQHELQARANGQV